MTEVDRHPTKNWTRGRAASHMCQPSRHHLFIVFINGNAKCNNEKSFRTTSPAQSTIVRPQKYDWESKKSLIRDFYFNRNVSTYSGVQPFSKSASGPGCAHTAQRIGSPLNPE